VNCAARGPCRYLEDPKLLPESQEDGVQVSHQICCMMDEYEPVEVPLDMYETEDEAKADLARRATLHRQTMAERGFVITEGEDYYIGGPPEVYKKPHFYRVTCPRSKKWISYDWYTKKSRIIRSRRRTKRRRKELVHPDKSVFAIYERKQFRGEDGKLLEPVDVVRGIYDNKKAALAECYRRRDEKRSQFNFRKEIVVIPATGISVSCVTGRDARWAWKVFRFPLNKMTCSGVRRV